MVRGRRAAAAAGGKGGSGLTRTLLMVQGSWRFVGGGPGGMRWQVRGRRTRSNLVSGARAFARRMRKAEGVFLTMWIVWLERCWGRFRGEDLMLGVKYAKNHCQGCCGLSWWCRQSCSYLVSGLHRCLMILQGWLTRVLGQRRESVYWS